MAENISPEKRRAIERSEREQQLGQYIDASGLSARRKEALKVELAKVIKANFNWGSVHLFLQRMEAMTNDIKEGTEKEKWKDLCLELRENLQEFCRSK